MSAAAARSAATAPAIAAPGAAAAAPAVGRPSATVLLDAGGDLRADPWTLLRDPGAVPLAAPLDAGSARLLLPLAAYLEHAPSPALGVWLAPDDDVQRLAGRIDALPLVAIDFPRLADGRGYSLATLLRTRLGFRGELRAIGEVLIDQLFMLKRVGFSSFALRADQKLADARAALARYSDAYQAAADGVLPAFRRHPRPAVEPLR